MPPTGRTCRKLCKQLLLTQPLKDPNPRTHSVPCTVSLPAFSLDDFIFSTQDFARRMVERRLDWAYEGVLDGTASEKLHACIRRQGHRPTLQHRKLLFDADEPLEKEFERLGVAKSGEPYESLRYDGEDAEPALVQQ